MLGREIWIQRIDFGLMVFIWTIQLVVYPSFKYFPTDSLLKWHTTYTGSVSIIVLPLMATQVALHSWRLYDQFLLVNLFAWLLVVSTWVVTFIIFVPLHNKIPLNHALTQNLHSLVTYNWIRTFLWNLIFFIGMFIAKDK